MSAETMTAAISRRSPPTNLIPLEMPVTQVINGVEMVSASGGGLVPLKNVKDHHKLEDQTVRICIAYAMELSAIVARFRVHTLDDVTAFCDELAEKFGGKRGGTKGNITLKTYDDCMKVEIKSQQFFQYGSELQQAKALVDQFIAENSEGANSELLTFLTHAFQVDQEGKVNRSRMVQLKRLEIDNDTWRKAMAALDAAERPASSKLYVRFGMRKTVDDAWTSISVDLAGA